MKITLVNHSDCRGGASVVTARLAKALADLGCNVTLLVVNKETNLPFAVQAVHRWRAKIPFFAEAARIFAANGFNRDDIFKVSLASDGLPLDKHPEILNADAVILAWVNQGMLDFKRIERIARRKPLIWVMHDMWNLTGICHHAGECHNYTAPQGCSFCPLLHSRAAVNDASAKVWQKKMRLYKNVPVSFVAVSSWLAECCRKSPLFKGIDVNVIPNAFPVDSFYSKPLSSRAQIKLPETSKIILMGAARLDDPVKGLQYAVDALNKLADKGCSDATAVFFGNIRNPKALDKLRFPHILYGPVTSPQILTELYAHAHTLISTSLWETLPGTLIEAQAAGAIPVSFNRGGQSDIIKNPSEGRLIPFGDTDAFADAVAETLAQSPDTIALRNAADRFSASSIAAKYINLINQQSR